MNISQYISNIICQKWCEYGHFFIRIYIMIDNRIIATEGTQDKSPLFEETQIVDMSLFDRGSQIANALKQTHQDSLWSVIQVN